MKIQKHTGFCLGEGDKAKFYPTVEAAQRAALSALIGEVASIPLSDGSAECLAADLLKSSNDLLDILTLSPRSKPKARKVAGTTNPQRAARRKVVAMPATALQPLVTTEQALEGFAAMREAAD